MLEALGTAPVFVEREVEAMAVKLLDFGIARAMNSASHAAMSSWLRRAATTVVASSGRLVPMATMVRQAATTLRRMNFFKPKIKNLCAVSRKGTEVESLVHPCDLVVGKSVYFFGRTLK